MTISHDEAIIPHRRTASESRGRLERAFRVVRGLTAVATSALLVLGALGALPASAATTSGGVDGAQTVAVVKNSSALALAGASTSTTDTCSDLVPLNGAPGGSAEGTGAGSLHVKNCQAVGGPGSTVEVAGEEFASRQPGGVLNFKLNDGKDSAAQLSGEQPAGTVDASGTLRVDDAQYVPGAAGTFSVSIKLPENLEVGGVYWIRLLAGSDDGLGAVSKWVKFRVAEPASAGTPEITAPSGSAEVTPGDWMQVRGSGFDASAGRPVQFSLRLPGTEGVQLETDPDSLAVSAGEGVAGAFAGSVMIPSATQPGNYELVVVAGTESATLLVTVEAPAAPSFTTKLASVSVKADDDITLRAAVAGSPRPSVKWEYSDDSGSSWTSLSQQDGARGEVSLNAGKMTPASDGRLYRVSAVNAVGEAQNVAVVTLRSNGASTTSSGVRPEGWNCESMQVTGDPNARLCIVAAVAQGGKLHLEGTGWKTADSTRGSCIAFKFDNGSTLALNPPTSDETGTCTGGGTTSNIFAYQMANDDGSWIADVQIPTVSTSSTLAAAGAEWADGETHSVTLLTGSSRSGDLGRSMTVSFGIGIRADPSTPGGGSSEGTDNIIVQQQAASATQTTVNDLVSVAQAEAGQRPLITPAAPVASEDDLTDLNRGDVEVETEGTVLTVTFPSLEPGAWVYLHAWPGPQAVDWLQLDADRKVRFDIVDLEGGDHKFSFVGQTGELVGWVDGTVPGDSGRRVFDSVTPIAGSASTTNWNGPLLLAAFGTLALGLVATTVLGIARGRRTA